MQYKNQVKYLMDLFASVTENKNEINIIKKICNRILQ